jgi:hypothetical protein
MCKKMIPVSSIMDSNCLCGRKAGNTTSLQASKDATFADTIRRIPFSYWITFGYPER